MSVLYVHIANEIRCEASVCAEPANVKEQLGHLYKELLLYNARGLYTFNIIPAFRKSLQNNIMIYKSNLKRQKMHGISRCSNKRLRGGNFTEDDNEPVTATSPWYFKLDYVTDRLPDMMAKAECTCRKCYNPLYRNGSGKCEKIESFDPVIRRICVSGIYRYFATVESVPVGCTCSRHSKEKKNRLLIPDFKLVSAI